MTFGDSYLGKLRELVGHSLILCPGAQVVLRRGDGSILLQRRSDNGVWELPAGSCEPGQSFASAATQELLEETGIQVPMSMLEPFACLSDPDIHTLTYPNGDRVHAFAMCFLVRLDGVEPSGGDGEAYSHGWYVRDEMPSPLHPPTRAVLTLLDQYLRSGEFQAR